MTTLNKLKLIYEGSVKKVWESPLDKNLLWFEFTDDYSVFDWGKMPDSIANKGRALTVMGAYFFDLLSQASLWKALKASKPLQQFDRGFLEQFFASETYKTLCESGCPIHFKKVTSQTGEKLSLARVVIGKDTSYVEVDKARVQRPEPAVVGNQTVFDYPLSASPPHLVPLEIVFRFGMPKGSSLTGRLAADPGYAYKLGLDEVPAEGEFFSRPVIELYTKLEPTDRLVSLQEALLLSRLFPEDLQAILDLTTACALFMFNHFAERGIELWDGKFEFINTEAGVALADSIGPDELRLMYRNCHLSKEMLRRVYRDTPWAKAVKQAQKIADEKNSLDWKSICKRELKQEPKSISIGQKAVIDRLYGVLANHVAGQPLFIGHPGLDDFVDMAVKEGLAEE